MEITTDTTFAQIHEYMRNEFMSESEQIVYLRAIYFNDPLAIYGMKLETAEELEAYYNYLVRRNIGV